MQAIDAHFKDKVDMLKSKIELERYERKVATQDY